MERKTYQRILVPLDGSELAERAIHYARTIAARGKGEIIVFSVCGWEVYPENLMKVYLGLKAEELKALGLRASPAVTYGDAADEIVNFAEKNNIDLVIMCTHGRSGVTRWITGSVSNKVTQESYIPLLLIRTGTIPTALQAEGAWKILIPFDGSRYSEAALPYATGIMNGQNSEITLFRVNESAELPLYIGPELIPGWEAYLGQAMPEIQEGIHNYLKGIGERLQSEGLKVNLQIVFGRAAEEIIKYAESHDIDLIVMTTHGRSGFSRWPYGSVASKVIHGASKPTLLIRPRPDILDSNS